MANELGSHHWQGPVTFTASGAISDGHAVKRTTAVNTAEECDSAGEASYGVAIGDAEDGRGAAVLRAGRYDRAVAGAAIATLHNDLAVNSTARYVIAVEGDVVVGQNLTAAAANGSLFTIELDTAGRIAPST